MVPGWHLTQGVMEDAVTAPRGLGVPRRPVDVYAAYVAPAERIGCPPLDPRLQALPKLLTSAV
jgi:hypothetical protein